MCVPVGRQRGGEQLWGLCDVVVVGASYRVAARGGRGRSLHAHLLQTLVLKGRRTPEGGGDQDQEGKSSTAASTMASESVLKPAAESDQVLLQLSCQEWGHC